MHHRPDVRELATGRWPGILAALGVDAAHLTGKHTSCPVCGGKDRFRFDDKGGRGTFFCTHCGAGDGFTLLQNLKGLAFRDAAREVEQIVGTVFAKGANEISTDAAHLTLAILIGDDPIGRSYALAAKAVELERRIMAFLETQNQALAAVIACDQREAERRAIATSHH